MIWVQSVQQKSEKINEEKIKCQHMADLAQADLAEAMPALEEAVKVYTLWRSFIYRNITVEKQTGEQII